MTRAIGTVGAIAMMALGAVAEGAPAGAESRPAPPVARDCEGWRATVRRGQALTDALRRGARIVPPRGAVTAEHVAGRRTIWMGEDGTVDRAACG